MTYNVYILSWPIGYNVEMSGACEYKPYRKEQEEIIERKQEQKIKKIEILRLTGIAIVMIFVAWMHLLQPTYLANIVVTIAVIVCGYPLYRESLSALRRVGSTWNYRWS